MKDIPLGHANSQEIVPEERHTAAAVGNSEVVSTPSLIGFLEQTSHRAILPFVEPGEAFVGKPVTASARIAAVEGRRITFEVEARQGDKLVMKGRHVRAIVSRDRLLGKKPGA